MALSYDELKDKVLQRYGNIDDIPDSVYNAMKNYKSNGDKALDDDKTYNILVGERDYKPEPLPEVPQDTPSDYSFVGFAEPTTREKAEEYVRQNNPTALEGYEQQSDADKNLANERAREYGDSGGSFYSLAHNILQVPIGAALSGIEYGKDKIFNEGDPNKPFYDYFKESQLPDAASNTLSDPSNFVGGGIKKWTTGAGFGGAQSGYEALERNPNASFNEVAVPTMIGAALGAGNVALMSSPSRFVDKRASDLAENIASKEALQVERDAIIREGIARSPYTASRQSMQIGDEIEAMSHGFDPQTAKYMAELKAGGRLAEGLKVVEVFGSKLDRNMELMKKMGEIGNEIERRQFMKLPAISTRAKMVPVVGAPISRFIDNTAAPIVSDILTSPISTKAALPAIQGVGFGLGKELTSR